MLFAVPPAFSPASFLVLQVASLISSSFHFGRSLTHNPQFHYAYIRFSHSQSSGCLLFSAHLRVASGCGLPVPIKIGDHSFCITKLFWKLNQLKQKLRQPLCLQHRSAAPSFHPSLPWACRRVSLRAFLPSTLAPFAVARRFVPVAIHFISCNLHPNAAHGCFNPALSFSHTRRYK